MKKAGMRTTLLGTKVECFHPVPDWDIVANLCKACGTTDEELSMGELGVDYPDEPEVPQNRTPVSSAFYVSDPSAISGSASIGTSLAISVNTFVQTADQASEAAERLSESVAKAIEEIPEALSKALLK